MKHWFLKPPSEANILSRSLRAIRAKRGKSARAVAESMGKAQRSYQRFEAGGGRISYADMVEFAEAVECDPFALIFGAILQLPDLAIDCADNKICLIFMILLEKFVTDRANDIIYLDPSIVIGGIERLFKELGEKLDEEGRSWDNFLADRRGIVGLAALLERFRSRWHKPRKPEGGQ